MIRKKFFSWLLTLALILSVTAGLTALIPVAASAESASGATVNGEYVDFTKAIARDESDIVVKAGDAVTSFEIAGVQIRTESPSGIRFVARISDEVVTKLKRLTGENVSYGILLQQKSAVDGDLVYDAGKLSTRLSQGILDVPGTATYQFCNGYLYYTAVVWNMPSTAWSTDIVARAYVKCGDTYYYATEIRPSAGYHTPGADAVGSGFSASLAGVADYLSADDETRADLVATYGESVLHTYKAFKTYVLAGDQRYGGTFDKGSRLVVYDMSQLTSASDDLEDAKVWDFYINNSTVRETANNGVGFVTGGVTDAKFRYDTVAGDVIVYSGNFSFGVIRLDSNDFSIPGESLYQNSFLTTASKDENASYWRPYKNWASTNVHSVEILPNGTLVVGETTVTSTGTVNGEEVTVTQYGVYFFRWNGETWDSAPFHYEKIYGGHSVMYDGEYLWAADSNQIHRFDLDVTVPSGEEFNEENYNASTDYKVYTSGVSNIHALANDFTDTNNLLVAGSYLWRFNKTTGKVTRVSTMTSLKGIGVTRNGMYYYTQAEGVTATASYTDSEGETQTGSGRVNSSYQTRRIGESAAAGLTDTNLYESYGDETYACFYRCQIMDGFYN